MARQPRIDFPGAVHHVMNRGAAHQDIFSDDHDRRLFLYLWAKAAARFDIEIVTYCLMGNHFHFLVLSKRGELSRALKWISQVYTQRFNARYGRDGALFRGRFHSILVDSDVYFERVGRYIELNPVTAGLTCLRQLHTYRWSSFQFYAGRRRAPNWLSTERMLSRYRSRDQYTKFVLSTMDDATLDRFYTKVMRPGLVLGRHSFVQELRRRHGEEAELEAGIDNFGLAEIDQVVAGIAKCEPEELKVPRRGAIGVPRRVASELAYRLTSSSRTEIANRYNYPSPAAAGWAINRTHNSAQSNVQSFRSEALRILGVDLDDETRS